MIFRTFQVLAVWACLGLMGCAPPSLYDWGQYEDSLYARQKDASESGQAEAFKMLEVMIQEADAKNYRAPPGVYADYGYLLFKQGKPDQAIIYFRKEAVLYKESKYLMDSIISRIEQRKPQ